MSFHVLTYLPNKNSAIVLFNIKAYIHLPKYSAIAKKNNHKYCCSKGFWY